MILLRIGTSVLKFWTFKIINIFGFFSAFVVGYGIKDDTFPNLRTWCFECK